MKDTDPVKSTRRINGQRFRIHSLHRRRGATRGLEKMGAEVVRLNRKHGARFAVYVPET